MADDVYRSMPHVANSDVKGLKAKLVGVEVPDNLQEIFAFGTLSHATILEPHLADYTHPDIMLALEMKDTFMKDDFCRNFIEHPDFKAEYEFYRKDFYGIMAKAKLDGAIRTKKWILEFKSLAVTTQKAFEESIVHFDYDMGAAWYLDVSQYEQLLIAGVSKIKTDKIFKLVVTRNDDVYKSGLEKYTEWVSKWKELLG